jgi:hypothetical protein
MAQTVVNPSLTDCIGNPVNGTNKFDEKPRDRTSCSFSSPSRSTI